MYNPTQARPRVRRMQSSSSTSSASAHQGLHEHQESQAIATPTYSYNTRLSARQRAAALATTAATRPLVDVHDHTHDNNKNNNNAHSKPRYRRKRYFPQPARHQYTEEEHQRTLAATTVAVKGDVVSAGAVRRDIHGDGDYEQSYSDLPSAESSTILANPNAINNNDTAKQREAMMYLRQSDIERAHRRGLDVERLLRIHGVDQRRPRRHPSAVTSDIDSSFASIPGGDIKNVDEEQVQEQQERRTKVTHDGRRDGVLGQQQQQQKVDKGSVTLSDAPIPINGVTHGRKYAKIRPPTSPQRMSVLLSQLQTQPAPYVPTSQMTTTTTANNTEVDSSINVHDANVEEEGSDAEWRPEGHEVQDDVSLEDESSEHQGSIWSSDEEGQGQHHPDTQHPKSTMSIHHYSMSHRPPHERIIYDEEDNDGSSLGVDEQTRRVLASLHTYGLNHQRSHHHLLDESAQSTAPPFDGSDDEEVEEEEEAAVEEEGSLQRYLREGQRRTLLVNSKQWDSRRKSSSREKAYEDGSIMDESMMAMTQEEEHATALSDSLPDFQELSRRRREGGAGVVYGRPDESSILGISGGNEGESFLDLPGKEETQEDIIDNLQVEDRLLGSGSGSGSDGMAGLDWMREEIALLVDQLEKSKSEQRRLQHWILERSHYEEELRDQWNESKRQMEQLLLQHQRLYDQHNREALQPIRGTVGSPHQQQRLLQHDAGVVAEASHQQEKENFREDMKNDSILAAGKDEVDENDDQKGRLSVMSTALSSGSSPPVFTKEEIRMRHLEYKRQSQVPPSLRKQGHHHNKERKAKNGAGQSGGEDAGEESDVESIISSASSQGSIYRTQDDRRKEKMASSSTSWYLFARPWPATGGDGRIIHGIASWTAWCLRLFVKVCFWTLMSLLLQVVVMGILFRPSPSPPSNDGPNDDAGRSVIWYRNRDYVADQPGYYTVANDGFGTETLAYCHDLVRLDWMDQQNPLQAPWHHVVAHLQTPQRALNQVLAHTAVASHQVATWWSQLEKTPKVKQVIAAWRDRLMHQRQQRLRSSRRSSSSSMTTMEKADPPHSRSFTGTSPAHQHGLDRQQPDEYFVPT